MAKQDRTTRRHRIDLAQIMAYILIVSIFILGLYQANKQDDELCKITADNRQVTRNLVVAIERLGTELVTNGNSDITAAQQESLDRFAEFKESQLRVLELPVCQDN